MARQGVNIKIKDQDRGLKALFRRLRTTRGLELEIGILGKDAQSTYPDGTKTIDVAGYHEFGRGVPERSFLRATSVIHEKAIARAMAQASKSILAGEAPRVALSRVGVWFEGVVKKRIAQGIPPALAQSTIDRKGSSTPLIDTGQLRNSISSQVIKK